MSEKNKASVFITNPRLSVFLTLLFMFILIGVYIVNFKCDSSDGFGYCPLSSKEEWGQFGDYFGGILNPILTTIVMIVGVMTFREQKLAFDNDREAKNTQTFLDATNRTLDNIERCLNVELSSNNKILVFGNHSSSKAYYSTLAECLEGLFDSMFFLIERGENIFTNHRAYHHFSDISPNLTDMLNNLYFVIKISGSLNVKEEILTNQMVSILTKNKILSLLFVEFSIHRVVSGPEKDMWSTSKLIRYYEMKDNLLKSLRYSLDKETFEEVENYFKNP